MRVAYLGSTHMVQFSSTVLEDMDHTNYESAAVFGAALDSHQAAILLRAAAAIDAGRTGKGDQPLILSDEDLSSSPRHGALLPPGCWPARMPPEMAVAYVGEADRGGIYAARRPRQRLSQPGRGRITLLRRMRGTLAKRREGVATGFPRVLQSSMSPDHRTVVQRFVFRSAIRPSSGHSAPIGPNIGPPN
jgi:hypothetical protein